MAKTNDIIENPVGGYQIEFLVTAEDSHGRSLKIELWMKVGGHGPPEHMHTKQIETFEVIGGTLGINVSGKEYLLIAGQKITAPINAPHKFWNAGNTEVAMTVELRPALRTEFFMETMYSLAKRGKVNKEGVPNLLQLAAILNEHYGEGVMVGPPIPAQKFLAKVIGGFAKSIGYKGFVPYDRT
jgi:mannose-6-phosphate isomerase-like protein (cupin superfamily)